MDQTLPPLMQALLVPWRFPGAASSVELVQTPISWVLLAGDLAYKIKKPLKLPFLDFSTLEKRHACCQEELRLNQRYAPDLYLAVIPICNTPEDPQLEGKGEPIEYAVKMRRFDEAARLDRVCDRVLAFEDGGVFIQPGNFSYYVEKRKERLARAAWEGSMAAGLVGGGGGAVARRWGVAGAQGGPVPSRGGGAGGAACAL